MTAQNESPALIYRSQSYLWSLPQQHPHRPIS
jgi:hypothetical protein